MAQDTSTRDHSKQLDSTAHELKERATDQVAKIADKATDQFKDIADQAEHVANRVSERGREASERVQEMAGSIKKAVDRSVKHQPMASLAMTAVMGFVIGAIWKS